MPIGRPTFIVAKAYSLACNGILKSSWIKVLPSKLLYFTDACVLPFSCILCSWDWFDDRRSDKQLSVVYCTIKWKGPKIDPSDGWPTPVVTERVEVWQACVDTYRYWIQLNWQQLGLVPSFLTIETATKFQV